jgi:hypothetical protein
VTGADACKVTCNDGGSPMTTAQLAGTESNYAKDRSGMAYSVSSTEPILRMSGGVLKLGGKLPLSAVLEC